MKCSASCFQIQGKMLKGCSRFRCNLCKKIEIPEGVSFIGNGVFSGTKITDVTIKKINSIGPSAFSNTKKLRNVTIGQFYKIDDSAFEGSSLERIELGDGYSIGKNAFKGTKLRSVTIPGSVGEGAFMGCSELEEVTFLGSSVSIGSGAFRGTAIQTLTLPNNVSIGSEAFAECNKLKSITIPGSVQTVSSCAFYKCKELKQVTILDGVVAIDGSAFAGCYNLEIVTIPASVSKINFMAFSATRFRIQYGGSEEQWDELVSEMKEDYMEQRGYSELAEIEWNRGAFSRKDQVIFDYLED